MFKFIKRLFLFVGVVAFWSTGAGAVECPPGGHYAAPEVSLRTEIAEPVVHNTRSRDEIRQLAGAPIEVKDLKHSGLTRSRTEFRVEPRVRWAQLGGGRSCVMLDGVQATWNVAEMIVDIARPYQPGSCEYREVRDHEQEHVRITRDAFSAYAPRLRERLKQAARDIRPVLTGDDPQQVAEGMLRQLTGAAQEVLDKFQRDLRDRHGAIDTMDNYRAISARCAGW